MVGLTQAADLLAISRTVVKELVRDGLLPAHKLGKRTLIRWEDLHSFAAGLPLTKAVQ